MKSTIRKRFTIFLTLICILLIIIYSAYRIIEKSTESYLYSTIDSVIPAKAGLLLGTNKELAGGYRNDYFYNRIDAAVELYKNKKIRYIIVSGDNSAINYNEPQDMKDELLKNGIPDSAIVLDHAGFRTFDSVIRAKEVFGQNTFIVISQKFHNERAVYIARKNNINAFGFNAKDVDAYKGFKTKNREYLARVKVFLDLWQGTTPRFLGEKVEIK